jgi:hypothetical protein
VFEFGVAQEVGALGIENYRSFVLGTCLGIRSLCILGVAGRCRIEKGPGTCTGRYCKADFDRRSSSVIHLNNSLKAVWSVVYEVHEWDRFSLRLTLE